MRANTACVLFEFYSSRSIGNPGYSALARICRGMQPRRGLCRYSLKESPLIRSRDDSSRSRPNSHNRAGGIGKRAGVRRCWRWRFRCPQRDDASRLDICIVTQYYWGHPLPEMLIRSISVSSTYLRHMFEPYTDIERHSHQ